MPSLDAACLAGNPSREPLTYPGPLVGNNCLLVGSWVYTLTAEPDREVADWRITPDGGPLGLPPTARVDAALARANAPCMAARQPVLAIGSNGSPGQLLHKFGADIVVPLTRVTVSGCTIGHSPHVSKPGYIPYVPIRAPADTLREFTITWLDRDQLSIMDASEPNYRRVQMDGYTLYRGRWGALRTAPDQPPVPATTQTAILSTLAALPWFRRLLPASAGGPLRTAEVLATHVALRDAVRAELRTRGLIAEDGME